MDHHGWTAKGRAVLRVIGRCRLGVGAGCRRSCGKRVRGWHGGQTSVVSGVMLGLRAQAIAAVLHWELRRPEEKTAGALRALAVLKIHED